jgi:hypothetical protein
MRDKKFLDNVNPERREFLEKVTKGAFIIPTVLSVMMLNQKLNLTTANAQSNLPPNCLSCDTLISTPEGNIRVSDLRTGMVIFTLDMAGNKVIEPVELVMKLSGAEGYDLRHIVLTDGRELIVSGTHPTAEYGRIADFCPGDMLDGSMIVSMRMFGTAAVMFMICCQPERRDSTGQTVFCLGAPCPPIPILISVRFFNAKSSLFTFKAGIKAFLFKNG